MTGVVGLGDGRQVTITVHRRRPGPGRPRVVDDQGRVQCRDCGEFKAPELMKWNKKYARCETICRKCTAARWRRNHPDQYRDEANARRRAQRLRGEAKSGSVPISRAEWRAMRRLIVLHRDEFDALIVAELEALKDEIPVGTVVVPEHTRTVYARPLDLHDESEP